MTVSVLVPIGGDCPYRKRTWEWVRARLEHHHPDWEIVEGRDDSERWSKGRALAEAATNATGDVFIVHDADSFIGAQPLRQTVERLDDHPWVVGHRQVCRLHEFYSDEVMAMGLVPDIPRPKGNQLARAGYSGVPGGGVTILRRETWERIPVDPRFKGWGGEDEAWGLALDTLLGDHGQGDGHLIHLWHPMADTHAHLNGPLPETEQLATAYKRAAGHPRLMRAVLEGRDPDPAPDPLPEPVTFRSRRRHVTWCKRRVHFIGRERLFRTDDPELVEILRRAPEVEEV